MRSRLTSSTNMKVKTTDMVARGKVAVWPTSHWRRGDAVNKIFIKTTVSFMPLLWGLTKCFFNLYVTVNTRVRRSFFTENILLMLNCN